ncbi:hypothetical protein TTHERM_00348820 (macronuclear) [Tetrahymena thermophila SB210]|uniref:Uncharacterized protein n=1 Tax=Tetrahymena thermophila (strain SB210) TaxID=312017 RepID=I7MLP1_TETTS|nr:hypothetical protein TTHERM_00348820 [Tetrahymena thermophila SB210]EAS02792.2 hypothetical protein TTHERM_00348820 [Tetrahymena thermophila SB210]|eukprot:XP_001023037.2 hypothetical protein TTHERM_00348820 [Tetrahymena thermophila SB210]
MNSICTKHNLAIEFICLHISKSQRDKKCTNRLLCKVCNEPQNHDKNHLLSTFEIKKFLIEDMSDVFFLLFFTRPQIQTLFKPLKINCQNIILKLKEMVQKLKIPSSNQASQIEEQQVQFQEYFQTATSKIQNFTLKINSIIEDIHLYYRQHFEWDNLIKIIELYYEKRQVSQEQLNQIINNSLQNIHCTQIFMKNVYVIDDNFNQNQSKQTQMEQYTTADIISFYKFAIKELYLNLNHLRSLFLICQPSQLQALEDQKRLSLTTNFPLNIKRFLPTVSMAKSIGIKLIKNKLLIIKEFQCQIINIDASTQEFKIQNTIYSKIKIKDASISQLNDSLITLLCVDNTAKIYYIKPFHSVFDNEYAHDIELSQNTEIFLDIDYIKAQSINNIESDPISNQIESEEQLEYVALKTKDTIYLLEPVEWNQIYQFQNKQEFFMLECCNEQDISDENSHEQMAIENVKKSIFCFYNNQQIDHIHYTNANIFESNQIKDFAYSEFFQKSVYLTERQMIISNQQTSQITELPFRNKQQVSLVQFTIDNLYLFILYENSFIQFFYVLDNFELEYETHLWKNNYYIKKAVFYQKINQLFVLNSQGDIFQIDLSTPKCLH